MLWTLTQLAAEGQRSQVVTFHPNIHPSTASQKNSFIPLPDRSLPNPNHCFLQKYPARLSSFNSSRLLSISLRCWNVPLLFNFIVVLACSQWKMPGTSIHSSPANKEAVTSKVKVSLCRNYNGHFTNLHTLAYTHATLFVARVTIFSLPIFSLNFYFIIPTMKKRRDFMSRMNVTAAFCSITYEKCLQEWEQRFLAGHIRTLHSLAKMWTFGPFFFSFFFVRVGFLFVFP